MTVGEEQQIRHRFHTWRMRFPPDRLHWTMFFCYDLEMGRALGIAGYFDPGIESDVIRFRDFQEAMDLLETMETFS